MIDDYEEEIKIEYYDNYLSDPLAGNDSNVPKKAFVTNFDTVDIKEKTTELGLNKVTAKIESEIFNWYQEIDCDGRYVCRYCTSKYSTVQTLRYHVRRKHSEEAERLTSLALKNKRNHKFKCHVCRELFQCLNYLDLHFKTKHHSETLSNSCCYCDATFKSVNELTVHQLNLHGNVKKFNYVCSICGYRTSKKSHFKQHQNTHSAFKSLKCKSCDYQTNYLPNLKIHERIHLNTKPYKCDYKNCVYACAAKSALRSHRLKHFPNENMLYCDKCNYKTVYKQSLKKHQDSHNRNNIGLKIV